MNETEAQYKDQSRWNQHYGKTNLDNFQHRKGKFVVDPTGLSLRKTTLLQAMPRINNATVLEVGSGKGEFAVALAKLGAQVTGIDMGEELVELSQRVAMLNGVWCNFMVGRLPQLNFANASFDYVVGNDILHHLSRRGVVESLAATHRVLKPGGMALFNEPIENSRAFDFIQNLFPVGAPDSPQYRPSILHRSMWRAHLANVDDRALSDTELAAAKGPFQAVAFHYCGLLIRLERWLTSATLCGMLDQVDRCMTHRYSPLKRFSRSVLAIYKK